MAALVLRLADHLLALKGRPAGRARRPTAHLPGIRPRRLSWAARERGPRARSRCGARLPGATSLFMPHFVPDLASRRHRSSSTRAC